MDKKIDIDGQIKLEHLAEIFAQILIQQVMNKKTAKIEKRIKNKDGKLSR